MDLRRFNVVLTVLGLALGATAAFLIQGGESSVPPGEGGQDSQTSLEVTRAATAQVQAFLGIDHRNVDAQAQVVLDGATGDFREQYADELDSLRRSARKQESTAEVTVLEVGVSDIDESSAVVLVAADTDVTSNATDGESRTVPWRIQLDMVKQGDRWLTSGLQFVG